MKRIDNGINASLHFEPFPEPGFECTWLLNHGLELPKGKQLYSQGIFTNGFLETNGGAKIQAAKRKSDSYLIHLVTACDYDGPSLEPIRLLPNAEPQNEVDIPNDFFRPLFNCHGCTFGDSEYWINPVKDDRDRDGKIVPSGDNVNLILNDEYEVVDKDECWDVAVFYDAQSNIVHSVRRKDGLILCKYDQYQLMRLKTLDEMDFNKYTIDRSKDKFFIENSTR